MTPSETSVALELERLRGTIGTGLSDIRGDLKVISERTSRFDQDLTVVHKKVADVEKAYGARIAALERKVWIACGAGGALGTVGGFLTAVYGG